MGSDARPRGPAESGDLDAEVRRVDETRWLAARFAPTKARTRLIALYAFHHEIARVRETVSDPLVGEIRLAWWREAIGEIYDSLERRSAAVRRHPVTLALVDALGDPAHRPARAAFESLIDARQRDLDAEARFADVGAVAAYAEATAGGLMRIAARLLSVAPLSSEVDAALAHAGRAWGLGGLARAFPAHAATGWVTVPGGLSKREIEHILHERDGEAVRAVTGPIAWAAREALATARGALKVSGPEIWPAYGYAALLGSHLRAMSRPGTDPFALAESSPGVLDRGRLVIAAARGTI